MWNCGKRRISVNENVSFSAHNILCVSQKSRKQIISKRSVPKVSAIVFCDEVDVTMLLINDLISTRNVFDDRYLHYIARDKLLIQSTARIKVCQFQRHSAKIFIFIASHLSLSVVGIISGASLPFINQCDSSKFFLSKLWKSFRSSKREFFAKTFNTLIQIFPAVIFIFQCCKKWINKKFCLRMARSMSLNHASQNLERWIDGKFPRENVLSFSSFSWFLFREFPFLRLLTFSLLLFKSNQGKHCFELVVKF